jgi:L-alanine-DL-glutamate epimerase-like enolase superfamily enzyme
MIKNARALNLKVMLGCMNESCFGTAALAHLAPLVDFLDADGPLLLKEDLGAGIDFVDYLLKPSLLPGLGIAPLLDRL